MGLQDDLQKVDWMNTFQAGLWHRSYMSMEYIVPSLRISAFIGMADRGALEERLTQLREMEEDIFLAGFHQQVRKEREKEWHDVIKEITNDGVVQLVKLN